MSNGISTRAHAGARVTPNTRSLSTHASGTVDANPLVRSARLDAAAVYVARRGHFEIAQNDLAAAAQSIAAAQAAGTDVSTAQRRHDTATGRVGILQQRAAKLTQHVGEARQKAAAGARLARTGNVPAARADLHAARTLLSAARNDSQAIHDMPLPAPAPAAVQRQGLRDATKAAVGYGVAGVDQAVQQARVAVVEHAPLTVKHQRASAVQKANIATVLDTGLSMHVSRNALVASVATVIQESTAQNLTGGDKDSVGLFQQRANWGPFAQRHDPHAAAAKFFRAALPYQRLAPTALAQKVQGSAYPFAYGQWLGEANRAVAVATIF